MNWKCCIYKDGLWAYKIESRKHVYPMNEVTNNVDEYEEKDNEDVNYEDKRRGLCMFCKLVWLIWGKGRVFITILITSFFLSYNSLVNIVG